MKKGTESVMMVCFSKKKKIEFGYGVLMVCYNYFFKICSVFLFLFGKSRPNLNLT